ncbi:MAG: hypothetical protein GX596_11620 [Propionibacterium sp.]|nr:hypothetical protein [Propionibacterium sp.]
MNTLTAQEDWLRASGLPFVVPARRRVQGLLPRTSAVLITFALLATALLIADAAISVDEVIPLFELIRHPGVLTALITAAVVAMLAIPAGIAYGRLQRRLSLTWRLTLGAVIVLVWLAGLSIAAAVVDVGFGLHVPIGTRLLLLVLAALLAFLELDRIVGWAARRSFHELTAAIPAVARILPLLLLTVLLAFFTGELWQIAAVISKTRMWWLGLFLVGLILLIVLPATVDMLDDEDTDDDADELLADTPFHGVEPTRNKLSLGERFNLVTVSMSVQAVQIAAFVVLTFTVFAIFGAIALTPELIERWSGAAPAQLTFVGIGLPMDHAMFRVCLVLALFSGVSFAASTLLDQRYRGVFLSRVADEVRRNLAARHRYRTTLRAHGKAPARWQVLLDLDG